MTNIKSVEGAMARQTRRFLSNNRGQVAVIFAVVLLPIAIAAGVALDYSRANGVKAQMQAALDNAVLAGLNDSSSTTTAAAYFNSTFTPKVTVTGTSTNFATNADGSFSGSATTNVSTAMLGMAHINTIQVSTSSTGKIAYTASNKSYCVVALSATDKDALNMSGSAKINSPNCFVQVNSNNAEAVNMSGSTQITSADNCFVGKAKTWSSTALSPSPDVACKAYTDPFASMTTPAVDACDYNKLSVSTPKTLSPGVYCGGLTISSTSVTFDPGLYIIKDGVLNASGGSVLTDNDAGVSFFLTGTGAGVTASGGSRFHLTAMSTGTLAGFVFFLDESGKPAAKSDISGSSELYFDGVMYFPGQLLNLSGGSGAYATAPFTSYIADDITLSGASTLVVNADPTKTTVPIPDAIKGASTAGQLYLSN